MSYVKSFKELDRKRRCFSFAGAKVGTFHNMTKHSRNFFLKKSSKKFGGYKNSPYLCIRFLKESHKEEFFERFRYEQASSTILT